MTPVPARRFPWLVLAYLGPLAVLPIVASFVWARGAHGQAAAAGERADDDDREIQWHAWQGFLLALVEVLVLVAITTLAGYTLLANVTGGVALGVMAWLLWSSALAIHLAAMVAALTDRRLEVPVLAGIASRLAQ